METTATPLQTVLRREGYSLTKPRMVVFDALDGQEPMTMHHLSEITAHKLDRASLYRTIAVFERIGIAQRLYSGWKYKIELTDSFARHHHHLTCQQCGQVIPIDANEFESFIDQVARRNHFQATKHQIEIQGLCPECQRATAAS